jgi:hypothetical protein
LPRIAFTPFLKEEIVALAKLERDKYGGMSIDEVAEQENIILIREPDAHSKKAGYACSLKSQTPKRIESLSIPGKFILSFREKEISYYDCIVINPLYGIPEREIFWHEFYHLWYSPSRQMKLEFFHQFSTGGTLDAQEEKRANIFAAYMLIPAIEREDSLPNLSAKWSVSERLARIRFSAVKMTNGILLE